MNGHHSQEGPTSTRLEAELAQLNRDFAMVAGPLRPLILDDHLDEEAGLVTWPTC